MILGHQIVELSISVSNMSSSKNKSTLEISRRLLELPEPIRVGRIEEIYNTYNDENDARAFYSLKLYASSFLSFRGNKQTDWKPFIDNLELFIENIFSDLSLNLNKSFDLLKIKQFLNNIYLARFMTCDAKLNEGFRTLMAMYFFECAENVGYHEPESLGMAKSIHDVQKKIEEIIDSSTNFHSSNMIEEGVDSVRDMARYFGLENITSNKIKDLLIASQDTSEQYACYRYSIPYKGDDTTRITGIVKTFLEVRQPSPGRNIYSFSHYYVDTSDRLRNTQGVIFPFSNALYLLGASFVSGRSLSDGAKFIAIPLSKYDLSVPDEILFGLYISNSPNYDPITGRIALVRTNCKDHIELGCKMLDRDNLGEDLKQYTLLGEINESRFKKAVHKVSNHLKNNVLYDGMSALEVKPPSNRN